MPVPTGSCLAVLSVRIFCGYFTCVDVPKVNVKVSTSDGQTFTTATGVVQEFGDEFKLGSDEVENIVLKLHKEHNWGPEDIASLIGEGVTEHEVSNFLAFKNQQAGGPKLIKQNVYVEFMQSFNIILHVSKNTQEKVLDFFSERI